MAHLLVVDDGVVFRETLAETLQGLGHATTEAVDGAAALAALKSARFDAVFLDHRMPGMDGLQTLAAMNAQLARVPPVIVLTAYASGGNTIDAMRLGAFDHLAKPIRRDAVLEVLGRALRPDDAAPAAVSDDDADALVGPSDAMREVHKRIGLAAAVAPPRPTGPWRARGRRVRPHGAESARPTAGCRPGARARAAARSTAR